MMYLRMTMLGLVAISLVGCDYEARVDADTQAILDAIATYQDDVDGLTLQIAALEAELADARADAATLSDRLEDIEQGPGDVWARLDSLDGGSQYSSLTYDSLADEVTGLSTGLATTTSTALGNDARLTDLENEVGDATNGFAASRIDLNEDGVSTNSTGIAANDDEILANAADIALNTVAIGNNASDIALNSSAIAANDTDIATNAADIAANASDILANTTAITTNATDISGNASNIAAIDARLGGAASAAWASPVTLLIDQDLTLPVPGSAPDGASLATVAEAMAWLDRYDISSDATVTVEVTGTVNEPNEVVLRHRDGDRVLIADGDGLAELQFTGASGFLVPQARSGGIIDGVDLAGTGSGGPSYGLQVQDGGALVLSSGISISAFDLDGVRVERNASLVADGSTASSNGSVGWRVSRNGSLSCWNCDADGNGSHGFLAARGGYLDAFQSTSDSNAVTGFSSVQGGVANCESCSADGNSSDGFAAINDALIYAPSAISSANGDAGFTSRDAGAIVAEFAVSEDNTVGYEAREHSYIRFDQGYATNSTSVGLILYGSSTAIGYSTQFTTPSLQTAVSWGDNSFFRSSNNTYAGAGGASTDGPSLGTTTDGSYAR